MERTEVEAKGGRKDAGASQRRKRRKDLSWRRWGAMEDNGKTKNDLEQPRMHTEAHTEEHTNGHGAALFRNTPLIFTTRRLATAPIKHHQQPSPDRPTLPRPKKNHPTPYLRQNIVHQAERNTPRPPRKRPPPTNATPLSSRQANHAPEHAPRPKTPRTPSVGEPTPYTAPKPALPPLKKSTKKGRNRIAIPPGYLRVQSP